MPFAEVIVAAPLFSTFTYSIPSKDFIKIGELVPVSFGRKTVAALVVEILDEKPSHIKDLKKIKEIKKEAKQEDTLQINFKKSWLELLQWTAEYYFSPPGEVLRSMLPPALLKMKKTRGQRAGALSSNLDFSKKKNISLNSEQTEVLKSIEQAGLEKFNCHLIHGVTGSGKTEVYLDLIEKLLQKQKAVLVLVPEIALTPQTVGRFQARLGSRVLPYHSSLTEAQRLKIWWQIKEGFAGVIIGTRSAIFLPFTNLAGIIIDEEHDPSYKQEERFRYQGRDIAIKRAHLENIPIVLGSATPALESYFNARGEKYHYHRLEKRAQESPLPQVKIINLKESQWDQDSLLSPELIRAVQDRLGREEQSLLFLNRRGYSTSLICHDCGHRLECLNCELALILHQDSSTKLGNILRSLHCHHCDTNYPVPKKCPECQSKQIKKLGVGTQRLEQKLKQLFPEARIARLDRDISSKKGASEKILSDFLKHEIDILLGTQLVVKGHDFPKLTLVGVLLAEDALLSGDFRATERTFQLLTQVAGRAGRADLAGEVFIQSFEPELPVITHAISHDSIGFFKEELQHRQALKYPPYSHLISFRFLSHQRSKAEASAGAIARSFRNSFMQIPEIQMLGPAPASVEKIRSKYRWEMMLKVTEWAKWRQAIFQWTLTIQKEIIPGVQLHINVDP